MKKNHTKRALNSMLALVIFVIATIMDFLIAGISEKAMYINILYGFAAPLSVIGLICFPAVALVCSVISITHSILALKGGESQWKNVLILIFAVLGIAAAVALAADNWHRIMAGIMSV